MKVFCIDFVRKNFHQFIVLAKSFDEANEKALKMLDDGKVDWETAPEDSIEMDICEFQPKECRHYIVKKKEEEIT